MLTRSLIVAAALAVLATPALATHCPKDIKAIDAAMSTAKLSAEQMSTVKTMRDQGEQLHKAGQHAASEEVLHKAMAILNISH